MALLSDKDRETLAGMFAQELAEPVKIVFFGQEIACQYCRETQDILEEVAGLSDKVDLEVNNFVIDKEKAEAMGVDKIPATVLLGGDKDYGVRFFGIPSGYEFTTLVQDIILVSKGKTEFSSEALAMIDRITEPVHLQVFITPTCPYCPQAVHMAHALAVASDKVTADMVESVEFPHLANKYRVQGVPKTVINEATFQEGAAPEPLFLARVLQGIGVMSEAEVDAYLEELRSAHEHDHDHDHEHGHQH